MMPTRGWDGDRRAVTDGAARPPTSPGGRQWQLLELEVPHGPDFDDPRHEWRRLYSELLGTFFLVLVGAGGGVVSAATHGAIPLAVRVAAPGLMVLGIILFMGAIGGAHLNP